MTTAVSSDDTVGSELKTVFDFYQEHGRLPRFGDPEPPWRFKGFLLPYVMQYHAFGYCADRWGYHLRQQNAGCLLDEPIPQIVYGPPNQAVYGMLADWARLVGWDMGGWSDWGNFLGWLCYALGVGSEYPRQLDDAKSERLYRGVNLEPLLKDPYDYLGNYVAAGRSGGWNPGAFYPTPNEVVRCMAGMLMHDLEGTDARAKTVCDPCVGSGIMLLHASNFSLRLYGQDIDHMCVQMCLINGALYAPWLSFPLPEEYFHGNQETVAQADQQPGQQGPGAHPEVDRGAQPTAQQLPLFAGLVDSF